MNSGHPGGMCTIHADSPRKALVKLVNLALQGAPNMTQEYMAELVGETIEMVVQVNRSVDGKRQVTAIAEVVGRQAGMVVTQDLWRRDRPGAPLIWTGVRPERCSRSSRLQACRTNSRAVRILGDRSGWLRLSFRCGDLVGVRLVLVPRAAGAGGQNPLPTAWHGCVASWSKLVSRIAYGPEPLSGCASVLVWWAEWSPTRHSDWW